MLLIPAPHMVGLKEGSLDFYTPKISGLPPNGFWNFLNSHPLHLAILHFA